MRAVLLLILAVQGAQDEIPGLIEKLRSLDIEARERATTRLKELEEKAVPALQKAAEDPDLDFRNRVRFLLRLRSVRQALGTRILKEVPGLDERLAGEAPRVWIDVIREATDTFSERHKRYERLDLEDYDRLLVAALRHVERAADRVVVLGRLEPRGIPEIIPDCRRLLKDPDGPVREHAVGCLSRLKDRESLRGFIALLKDEHAGTRAAAARALSGLRAKESIGPLVPLLKDDDWQVRRDAVDTLGCLRAKEVGAAVQPLLRDAEVQVRESALDAIGEIGFRKAIPDVAAALKDKENGVREAALRAMVRLGAREARVEIFPCLSDEDWGIRGRACIALGQLDGREMIPELLARLRDPQEYVRESAGKALALLKARQEIARVKALLADPDGRIRATACAALEEFDATEAIPDLAKLLEDPDRGVRIRALTALRVLRAEGAIPRIRPLLEDPSAEVRATCAYTLGHLGARDSIPALLELLGAIDAGVVDGAAEALRLMGVKEALPGLRTIVGDGRRATAVTIRALAQLGGREEKSVLLPILRLRNTERESGIVGEAMSALAEIGAVEVVPELQKMLHQPRRIPDRRIGAAMALCSLGLDDGVPVLLEHCEGFAIPRYLNRLNRLRQPDLVRAVQARSLTGMSGVEPGDLLDRFAAAAGLALDRSPGAEMERIWLWPGTRSIFRDMAGRSSVWETFDFPLGIHGFYVVLEPGKLRILPEEEAFEFWKAWWKERQAKKEK